MRIRKEITRRDLERMSPQPCYRELDRFQQIFGGRAAFTIGNAKRAAVYGFPHWWLASRLFDRKVYRRYSDITYILTERKYSEGKGLSLLEESQMGWTAFAAVALNLKLKPTGWSFDALGEQRDFLARWLGKDK